LTAYASGAIFLLARACKSYKTKHTGILLIPSSPTTADTDPAKAQAASHKLDGDREGHIVRPRSVSRNRISQVKRTQRHTAIKFWKKSTSGNKRKIRARLSAFWSGVDSSLTGLSATLLTYCRDGTPQPVCASPSSSHSLFLDYEAPLSIIDLTEKDWTNVNTPYWTIKEIPHRP
jgi:hypothetical protein